MINLTNMKKLSVSIIPSFVCKTNCRYCYLGDLRKDSTKVPVHIIKQRLQQLVDRGYCCDTISIYGGELSLLPIEYLDQLFETTKQYCERVGISTNGQQRQIFDLCKKHNVDIAVSLNKERPDYKRNLKLIKQIDCSVGVVVLPSVLNSTAKQFCDFFDDLQRDVYLFQYYQADQNSEFKFSNQLFTDWVVDLLQYYHKTTPHNFNIINEYEWTDCDYNPDDSGFIYITPNGKFATTQYENNLEHYCYFDCVDQWEQYCKQQQLKRVVNCGTCLYFGQCKAEHVVVYNDPYCSGLQKVIQFYQQNR